MRLLPFFFVLSGFVLSIGLLSKSGVAPFIEAAMKRWPRLAGTATLVATVYILAAWLNLFPSPDYVLSTVESPYQF